MNAFEILVNGERVTVASANRVLRATVYWTRFIEGNGGFGFDVGGTNDEEFWANHGVWPVPVVGVGDEITIRIISTNSIDPPLPRVSAPYPKPTTPPQRPMRST